MKRHIAQLSVILGICLGSTLPLLAEELVYTFTDPTINDGDMASVFVGDIASGEVKINLESGNYTVTWVSSGGARFMPPLQFILNLGNAATGDVVSLSKDYHGYTEENIYVGLVSTYTYTGNDPTLMDWLPQDIIVTSGTADEYGVNFQSGIFSLFPGIDRTLGTDLLSSVLELEAPQASPLPDSDGDGITDDIDPFTYSDLSPTVILNGVDTGVPNIIPELPVSETGTSLTDYVLALMQTADTEAKNHGDYVQRLGKAFKLLERDGWINSRQRAQLLRVIAQSAN